MRELSGLRSRLRGLLARALARRFLAWLACAAILISLGAAAAMALGLGAAARLGLALAALSALPAFLLWPAPDGLLERGLRRFDEDSVFESFIEAPPGPARELLASLAAARSDALSGRPRERIPRSRRLVLLLAAAAACFVSVEGASLLLHRPGILIDSGARGRRAGGREEEGSFGGSENAVVDELARNESRQERESRWRGEAAEGGEAGDGEAEGLALDRRRPGEDERISLPMTEGTGTQAGRETDMASADEVGGTDGTKGDGIAGPASGDGAAAEPERAGGEREGGPRTVGRTGRGYESSADTGIPSPLLDYRARFSRVYAERMGKRFTASGKLGLDELGEFTRRFFGSFALSVDAPPAEDPYESLLRLRWRELRGGLK